MAYNYLRISYIYGRYCIRLGQNHKSILQRNYRYGMLSERCQFGTSILHQQSSPNATTDLKNDAKSPPELYLSDSCVTRLKKILDSKESEYLRVTIEGGGCSGFQYKFALDSSRNDDDKVFRKDGVAVVIDETSVEYIRGATIDYGEELIKSGFRIVNNPVADGNCSCGVSFSIKI